MQGYQSDIHNQMRHPSLWVGRRLFRFPTPPELFFLEGFIPVGKRVFSGNFDSLLVGFCSDRKVFTSWAKNGICGESLSKTPIFFARTFDAREHIDVVHNIDCRKPNNRILLLPFINGYQAKRYDYQTFVPQRIRFIFRSEIS